MWKYIVKRLLLLIVVFIGVSFVVFTILNLKPGDPGRMFLGLSAPQEAVDAYNENLGLNEPFMVRYVTYMKDVILHGDFGNSWFGGEAVLPKVIKLFPVTLTVCILAILFAMIFGIPIGILSAVKQYSPADRVFSILAMILTSIPAFWLALLLLLLFALQLKWVPAYGVHSFASYILPMIVLGASAFGATIRLTRSSMLEEIRKDYVRTARSKGAKESRVIFKHALKNSLIPVVTACGGNFSLLLGCTVYVETVFALPGIGAYLFKSISNKDIPVVMCCTLIISILVVIINLIVDIVYAYLDPRIKAKYQNNTRIARKRVR